MLLAQERQTSERDCGRAPHGACRAQALAVRDARDTSLFTPRGGINRISSCCDFRSCRGARVPALSRRPNGPLIRVSGSISSSRQPDLVWLAIRDISSLRGTGELCGRCFGIGRFFFTRGAVRCRRKFLTTARQPVQDFAEPSPVGLHAWSPSYGSNRSRRSRAWRYQKQISRYIE